MFWAGSPRMAAAGSTVDEFKFGRESLRKQGQVPYEFLIWTDSDLFGFNAIFVNRGSWLTEPNPAICPCNARAQKYIISSLDQDEII